MNKFKRIALAGAILLVSAGSNAELISTDWKVVGDSRATIDSSSGLEWLDLTETKLLSFNQIYSQLDSTYVGWRFPTEAEVLELTKSITPVFGDTGFGTSSRTTNYVQARLEQESYFDKFGALSEGGQFTPWNKSGTGMFINDEGEMFGIGINLDVRNTTAQTRLVDISHQDANFKTTNFAYYLVSDGGTTLSSINNPEININNENAPINSVPLPATLGLLGLAMAGLSFRRKSK